MPFNMSVFTGKPWKYKCGVILLIIGTFLYILAFSAPFWLMYQSKYGYEIHGGLWQFCSYGPHYPTICYSVQPKMFFELRSHLVNAAEKVLRAVQALQCVGLVGLILATWNEVQTNFYDARLPCGYFTEVTGGLGSVAGLTGAMVFVYGVETVLPADSRLLFTYSWCLFVNILGTVSCALGTFLTFRFKRYGDTEKQAHVPWCAAVSTR